MDTVIPGVRDLKKLTIDQLGDAEYDSPLSLGKGGYISEASRILCYCDTEELQALGGDIADIPSFESAGPRRNVFFDPARTSCGIVTCGGLCPGLNDVIRAITLTCLWQYKAKKVLGFRHGYHGLSASPRYEPIELTEQHVHNIHNWGGTILGSSRGHQDPDEIVETLCRHDVSIIFCIGGDGTLTGAHEITKEVKQRKLPISVIGIPKTIDNDIFGSQVTFGFNTAVEEARKVIQSAHVEARAEWNGIGLVKLMGRDSGYIAVGAALANSDVNFCLIPEEKFTLEGDNGLLERLKNRLQHKHHAVIAVAEGAGQDLLEDKGKAKKDSSGNIIHKDIGLFLKSEIEDYFSENEIDIKVKYHDPGYTIRSCPANARDSILCLIFGQNAVHAGMAGKTDMFIGIWNDRFTHIPISATINKRKKLNVDSPVWKAISSMLW